MSTSRCKGLMHKVPPLLRLGTKSSNDLFDPLLVSIGPYHHGKPELQLVEGLKPRAVQMFVDGSDKDRDFYLNKILENISDVRSCYVEGSTDEYDDVYLANMMLQDACLLFKYEVMSEDPATIFQVGRFLFEYIHHDIVLLENQIPLWILELLNYSTSDGDNSGTLLDNLITSDADPDWDNLKLEFRYDNPEDEPFHLLELSRRINCYKKDIASLEHTKSTHAKFLEWLVSKFPKLCSSNNKRDEDIEGQIFNNSFRSAMDLKARGIHCKVGTSGWGRLEDIKFKSTYFYGELQLPKRNITIFSKVYFSNVIALENYLVADKCLITAYVNIMKILLQSTKDVSELREKHILTNLLRSDEDVLQLFLDLPVTSWDTLPPFSKVLDDLEVYYRKHTNKWVAELIQTYFRSPWTTIAFIAAALLVVLTMIQTYFAIRPRTP